MLAVLVEPLCVPTAHQTGAQLQSSQPDSQEASLKPLADGSCPEGTCPLGRCPQGTSPQGTSPQGTNPQGTRPTIVECVPVPCMQDPPCPIPPVCGPDLPACPTAECTCVEVDGKRYWLCPGEAGGGTGGKGGVNRIRTVKGDCTPATTRDVRTCALSSPIIPMAASWGTRNP